MAPGAWLETAASGSTGGMSTADWVTVLGAVVAVLLVALVVVMLVLHRVHERVARNEERLCEQPPAPADAAEVRELKADVTDLRAGLAVVCREAGIDTSGGVVVPLHQPVHRLASSGR